MEWPGLKEAKTIKKIFQMELTGSFYYFLIGLSHGIDSYYKLEKGKIWPLLMNPADAEERGKALFYLLLHNGYLTRSEEKSNYFKIPNKEILVEFKKMVRKHLRLFYEKVDASELLKAMETQNFESFGNEITKSLYPLFSKRKDGESGFLESDIEKLIHLYALELADLEDGYVVVSQGGGAKEPKREDEKKPDSNELTNEAQGQKDCEDTGFRYDLHLKPKSGDNKFHYLIELKRQIKDDERISEKALEALKQIYARDYFRHMILEKNTKAIVTMGLAAYFDKVCLATLKIDVSNELISGADTLSLQKFEIIGKYNDNVKVECGFLDEIKIEKPKIKMKSGRKSRQKEYKKRLNEAYRQAIEKTIEDMVTKRRAKRIGETSEGSDSEKSE
jgi:hypothetical protein